MFSAADLRLIDSVHRLDYARLSNSLKSTTDKLIAKYKKIAVEVSLNGASQKVLKVPGQSIYIFEKSVTLNTHASQQTFQKPTTIIVE